MPTRQDKNLVEMPPKSMFSVREWQNLYVEKLEREVKSLNRRLDQATGMLGDRELSFLMSEWCKEQP